MLISENINTDFESVKNYVEVLGHTWDVDYYSPSESTTVSGGTITPTFADLKALEDGTAVGITLPVDVNSTSGLNIDFLGTNKIVDIDSKNVQLLSKDTEWIFQFVPGPTLPNGYTELEYIQSGGTQYINTGVSGSVIKNIEIDFQFLKTVASGTSNEAQIASIWIDTSAHIQTGINSNGFMGTDYMTYSQTSDVLARTQATGAPVGSPNYNLYLFAQNQAGSLYWPCTGRIYSCKISNVNGLIRNFIPCKNTSGVIGLYDTVNSQFYQNAGTGTFIAGPEIPSTEDKGGPFWRFMGHQQAQATSYDDNPASPFYVGDPIGSSSVGRIRIVLYGGEYDNIYSDDLAQQRADFEIYQRSRLNDSISMETIPIPWMDANIVISHRFGQKQEPSKYIVKSFSVDYATGGTMTINAISWYPYYEESEVV